MFALKAGVGLFGSREPIARRGSGTWGVDRHAPIKHSA